MLYIIIYYMLFNTKIQVKITHCTDYDILIYTDIYHVTLYGI